MIDPVAMSPAEPLISDLCDHVRSSLSIYLDGAVTGVEMQRIGDHLDVCSDCAAEFELTRRLQQTLATLGPPRVPPDLSLRLRLAISHEGSRSWASRLERFSLTWQNAFRPLIMQASAGFAGAVALVDLDRGVDHLTGRRVKGRKTRHVDGVTRTRDGRGRRLPPLQIGGQWFNVLGAPAAVMANDEPLGAMTAPHYLYSVAGIQPVTTAEDSTIIVEALVNARGQVYDYRIVSGPQDAVVRSQVVDRLLACVFQPASVFGVPVRGHVVMAFAGISVRG